MRIRKHAKLAGLMFANATSSGDLSPRLQPHICHLNQSPWDVIAFPPDSASCPYQVDGEDSFTANGSFGDSLGAVESVASMKISVDGEERNFDNDAPKQVFSVAEKIEDVDGRKDQLGFGKCGTILCCKSDGKGWQCKKEASQGHSLCEHHLAQLRTYNSLAHPSGKKSEKPAAEKSAKTAAIRCLPRPKKGSSASNPYEFYYYSGFGPRWGKKRGTRMESSRAIDAKTDEAGEIIRPFSSSQIDNEEFDYVEDDDDDDENGEESSESGKKRPRKPIKARSLKSLM